MQGYVVGCFVAPVLRILYAEVALIQLMKYVYFSVLMLACKGIHCAEGPLRARV
jgi:hypothetical protein